VRLRRRIPVIYVVGSCLLGAGIAYAAWTSSGAGSATAQATTSVSSVIAAGTSAADLFPGAVKTVTVTISNPNPYPVLVTSISAGTSVVVNATCVAGTVTSDARTLDASGLLQSNATRSIGASGSGTYTLTTRMTASAADGCQGQSFALALTATVSSNA
jgi:hypothetical protein